MSDDGIEVEGDPLPMTTPTARLPVVPGLRPKQVLAATYLVQGAQGKEVATLLRVSEETVSRWRHQPEFEFLMRELLQESIDATRLGLASLCAESVIHLRGLIRAFDDKTALKAIALLLSKMAPVLTAINAELGRPPGRNGASTASKSLSVVPQAGSTELMGSTD